MNQSNVTTLGKSYPCYAILGTLLLLLYADLACSQLFEVEDFGENPGNLQMFKYLPTHPASPAPLVIALHGCTQTASEFGSASGWMELAERQGFVVLLPQQRRGNNISRCFNWYRTVDVQRGQGEALSIRQMIKNMVTKHDIDSGRIFITGVSAGGAMANAMLATYPEVLSGGAMLAALPYGCANGFFAGLKCMFRDQRRSPVDWGRQVTQATQYAGPWPRVSIWHGRADDIVNPANATVLARQWTAVHDIDLDPELEETLTNGTLHTVYNDNLGNARVELYLIPDMGHGVPVDPGQGKKQCGQASFFFPDVGLCAAYHITQFWHLGKQDIDIAH